jgi:hypothetical protein
VWSLKDFLCFVQNQCPCLSIAIILQLLVVAMKHLIQSYHLYFPYKLAATNMRTFVKNIQRHWARLQRKFTDEEIDQLSQEFSTFLRAYREEPIFQEVLLCFSSRKHNFSDSWAATHGRFPLVQKFCGGLASTFPNKATVDFDFLVIN